MTVAVTTIEDVSTALARIIRDHVFNGEELALIEPFNGPRPNVTHATVHFIGARPFQHPIKRKEKIGDRWYEVILGIRECRYRIGLIGLGSRILSVKLQNFLKSTLGAEYLMAPILGFGQIHETNSEDIHYLGREEERSFFNIDLRAKMSDTYTAIQVAQVNVGIDPNINDDIIPVQVNV